MNLQEVIKENNNMAPGIRWNGSKNKIASWVVQHIPKHKIYVEPFGGGGAVLFNKKKSKTEIYNDVDKHIVNVFRVLRDKSDEIHRLLSFTEKSQYVTEQVVEILKRNFEIPDVEIAWATLIKITYSIDRNPSTEKYYFLRTDNTRSLYGKIRVFEFFMERLKSVAITNEDAFNLINSDTLNKPNALFYLDPPYLNTKQDGYKEQWDIDKHEQLLDTLAKKKFKFLLSSYDNDLYINWANEHNFYIDYNEVKINNALSGSHNMKRREVLIYNYDLPIQTQELFPL